MKSKPVYNPISFDPTALRHVFIGDVPDSIAAFHDIVGAAEQSNTNNIRMLVACPAATLIDALRKEGMGTAFYVAGAERFLWEIHRTLRETGVAETRIQLMLVGSAARSVYCIHCGTIDGPVEDRVHICTRCGTRLVVRDHFSRYHGAYMGVRA